MAALAHHCGLPGVTDPKRLDALRRSGLQDAGGSESMNRLCRLATELTGAPVGLFSVVGDTHQTLAGVHGLPDSVPAGTSMPLTATVCKFVVCSGDSVVIQDVRETCLTAEADAMLQLNLVAYAGVPLTTQDGNVLGSLCVLDEVARPFSDDDLRALRDLAATATAEIELRAASAEAHGAQRRAAAILDSALDCIITMDEKGRVVDFNPAAQRTFGYTLEQARGQELAGLVVPEPGRKRFCRAIARAAQTNGSSVIRRGGERIAMRADGSLLPVEVSITRTVIDTDQLFSIYARDLTERHEAEAVLRRTQDVSRRIVDVLEEGVVVLDESGRVVVCNPSAERIMGFDVGALLGRRPPFQPCFFADGTAVDAGNSPAAAALRDRRPNRDVLLRIERPDGAQRWVCINYMPLGDDTLAAGGLLWSFTDVTESRDSERVQREAEERLQTVVSGADVIIGMLDADGVFTLSEGHRLRRLGLQPHALVGRRFQEVYAGNAEALEQCRRALAGERFAAETRIGELWFHTHYSPVLGPDGTVSGVIGVSTDITDHRRDKDRLEFLAFHDELTGAPKRAVLEQHLTTALHEARMAGTALAVLHLDLDRFKVVNDTIGLSGGDELLREVAARLRARWDPSFARPTADEFLIVVPGLGADVEVDATAAAREVLGCLEQPFAIADTEFEMAGTIGVAVFPRDGETSAELLQHADTAVRYAKRTARGGHAFYDAQKDRRVGRLTLNARMRRALAADEFVLHYQPVFDVATGRTQGVEALLRWNDPQAGMIPPGDFIPAAEDSGLIVPIGEWVINAVLAQSAAWAAEGLHPQIAFNVSPRQLQATGFGDGLIAAVEAGGVDPKRLVVEITESAAMADPDRTRPLLDRLTATGMRLAIDDFGAEFSSLARLRDLPADALKIDRAFLRGVPDDRRASEIVMAILSLARALDLQAVAEGVEEQAQLDFLQRRRCPWAQGFHLARPMPAAAVTPLLRAG